MIITISREAGSGGRSVGKMLAGRLGYDFYDDEIIAAVSKEMGLDASLVKANSEHMSDQTYIDMVSGFVPFSRRERIPFEEIKAVQNDLVRRIADRGDCVIVGRGADYVLEDREDVFNLFIHADMEHRIARTQVHEGITGQERRIRRELEVKDRSRGMFYNYFSGKEWGRVGNYHLAVDTSVFTLEQTTEIIIEALKRYREGRKNA